MSSKLTSKNVFLALMLASIVVVFPEASWAFLNEDAAGILPESRADQSIFDNAIWIIILLALVFSAAVLFFGIGDLISSLFGSLQEARKTNEWGGFLRNLAIIFIVLLVSLAIAAFLVEIASNVRFNPTVNVG